MPTSTNCNGVNTKKTQNSVRWSPGRVGVSVMNSRRAQNEIRPNSTTVAVVAEEEGGGQDRANSIHQAWTRQAEGLQDGRVRCRCRSRARSTLDDRPWPRPAGPARAPTRPRVRRSSKMSHRVCSTVPSAAARRRGPGRENRPSPRPPPATCGGPKVMQLKQRHRQHLAARQDAVHVVDVHGDQFQVGPLLAQVVQTALELADLPPVAAARPREKRSANTCWPISRIIRSTGLWWTLISVRSIRMALNTWLAR